MQGLAIIGARAPLSYFLSLGRDEFRNSSCAGTDFAMGSPLANKSYQNLKTCNLIINSETEQASVLQSENTSRYTPVDNFLHPSCYFLSREIYERNVYET